MDAESCGSALGADAKAQQGSRNKPGLARLKLPPAVSL